MDQAAQNNAQNAQNANGDEEMEVVPPHLDPLNQGAIIANLKFQLNQMRLEIDRGRNQHLLGVMDNAPDVPGVPVDEALLPVIDQNERHRIEEEEEQLALEYEEEADDISRLRGRSQRSRETKSGFRNCSARQ